ncbi:uncharacterized protein LOC141655707 [Silene latifolia]|uniref:uncharacterized protein LOC141655707 n=1 Tax=Silene latifolia TaxID=37657 RepID=UPI003D76FE21
MNITFWNVRGTKRKNFAEELNFFSSSNGIKILAICDTKSSTKPDPYLITSYGFNNCDFIPSDGFSGGIWLFWKETVSMTFSLNVPFKSSRFIACEVCDLTNNVKFYLIFVYAPAQLAEKSDFWNEFQNFVLNLDLPFLVLGDLNEIKNPSEKEGGAKVTNARCLRLNSFLSNTSCVDLPFSGNFFTWRKKKTGSENVFEILDKALASPNWMSIYPNMQFVHHAFTSSDHCPISVKFYNQIHRKAPPFRFELMWTLRDDFSKMVKSCWQYQFQGSYMFCLSQKCKFLKQKAKTWNQSTFGNIFRQLSIAEKKLENIQKQLGSSHIAHLENAQLRWLKKRDALLDYKRVYWQQKSRITKVNFGDNNTKFFQNYATIRRNRNGIKQFINKNGACITDQELIKQEISDEFTLRFTKNQLCNFDKNEDFKSISGLITDEDNRFLTGNISREEVKQTVFSLAADKCQSRWVSAEFFQKYRDIVGNSVTKVVLAFFHSREITKRNESYFHSIDS